MMMRVTALLLLIATASAAPALVWKNQKDRSSNVVHSADNISSEDMLADVLRNEPTDASVAAVVFLLGRGQGGTESLSKLAGEGLMPNVAAKQEHADCVHHHVSGVESAVSVASEASRFGHSSLIVDLREFSSKLSQLDEPIEIEVSGNGMMSKSEKSASKRARQLSKSNVLIVNIDSSTNPTEIDAAVSSAIDNSSVNNVILSAVRSVDEVKLEREMHSRRRLEIMHKAGSRMVSQKNRRLEDQQQDDGGEDGQNNGEDLSGIYYVALTPNIFAGILFFIMFTMVTYIGIGCMGMIQGQDVYVTKMPAVGREA